MNRTLVASFVVALSFLAAAGIQSSDAAESDEAVAPTELDDGLLRWLTRARWWRQVPDQPALPTMADISYDRLTVSWMAPESAVFEIVGYDVQYRASDDGRYVHWAHEGTGTEATVTGLAEVTEYTVRVRARNDAGEGDWSASVSGTTLVAPPRFLEGENADRELNENTPAGEPVGDPVTARVRSGEIRYGLGGEDADSFEIDASSGQLLTRQGVNYNYEERPSYEVEVEASNVRVGTGRILVRIALLDVDEPPGKPDRPAVTAVGSTGLRVTWVAPSNTGPVISGYDLEYREHGTVAYLSAEHEGTRTSASITGLARQTRYEVRVRALNEEGTGVWSETAQARTGGGGTPAYAPASESAFDALFVGSFLSTESTFILFVSAGRIRERNEHPGAYTYASTGSNTGTLTQTYDDTVTFGGSCTIRLTFRSETSGTLRRTCDGGQRSSEQWRLDSVDPGAFNIEIIPVGDRSSPVDRAFGAAVERWESVIRADTSAVYIPFLRTVDDLFDNGSTDKIFGVIDDLRIYAQLASIDGPGGTLAIAGPFFVRVASDLPAVSRVTLDADDAERLTTVDLRGIILHEVAHALGFGTRWDDLGLLNNPSLDSEGEPVSPVPDTYFSGANAIAAFDEVGGTGYTGEKVPVENAGGSGTADGHWRDSVFGKRELMNGYRILGSRNADAMSLVTIQSMADLGYTVDVDEADAYTLPASSFPAARSRAGEESPANWIPLKCIVTRPVPAHEVTLIELDSGGLP